MYVFWGSFEMPNKLLKISVNACLMGKAVFPSNIEAVKDLADLIGNQSRLVLKALSLGGEWLSQDPSTWHSSQEYVTAKNIVNNFQVTNDVAERGVKLMVDFADCLTHDENERQKVLQMAEHHRQRYPKFTKEVLKL